MEEKLYLIRMFLYWHSVKIIICYSILSTHAIRFKKCCPTHVFFFLLKTFFFRECSIKTSSHWGDSTGHWYFEEVLSNYGHCQMFEFLLSKYTINAVSMQLIILQLLRATEGTIWPKLTLLNLNSPNVCNVQGYPILSHSMFFFSPKQCDWRF